jgi:DNA ligase-1
MDGEIMIPGKTFNEAQGDIMREEGEPNFQYNIFDYIDDSLDEPFEKRYEDALLWCKIQKDKHFKIVRHYKVKNEKELLKKEEDFLSEGYEGLMVRKIDGPYKSGRSTLNEGYLLKFKRFVDSEAEITGFVELMINNNPKEVNELGDNIRKKKKEFLVPGDTLGVFLVKDLYSGIEFEIGTGQGLTKELRKEIWEHQKKYKTKIVKYRFQEAGKKDKPRFPSWLGFRDPRDMS